MSVEVLRPIDYDLATGVYPDMTEQRWDHDDWPEIYEKVKAAANRPVRLLRACGRLLDHQKYGPRGRPAAGSIIRIRCIVSAYLPYPGYRRFEGPLGDFRSPSQLFEWLAAAPSEDDWASSAA